MTSSDCVRELSIVPVRCRKGGRKGGGGGKVQRAYGTKWVFSLFSVKGRVIVSSLRGRLRDLVWNSNVGEYARASGSMPVTSRDGSSSTPAPSIVPVRPGKGAQRAW